MISQVFSRTEALVFYGLSLVLILSIMLYRTDLAFAQGDGDSADAPVLTPRPTQIADDDGDDDDGLDPPTDDDDDGLLTFTFTVRQGDTLSHIALYLGVSLESLAAQADNPSLIFPGQKFTYRSERSIDTPPLFTDNDGTDSDGYDTPAPTDNDGTDSDGYDTPPPTDNPSGLPIIQQSQPRVDPPSAQSQQQRIDTPPPTTDSDGYDTTGNAWTDNDGTDSDGYDTPPPTTDNDSADSADSDSD